MVVKQSQSGLTAARKLINGILIQVNFTMSQIDPSIWPVVIFSVPEWIVGIDIFNNYRNLYKISMILIMRIIMETPVLLLPTQKVI